MDDDALRQALANAKAATEVDADKLTAALEVLEVLGARSEAGRTRNAGKAIRSARRAATDVRNVLGITYGREA